MIVYKTPASSVTLSQNGTGNSASTVQTIQLGGRNYNIPINVVAEKQITKSGVRRSAIKVVAHLPKGHYDPSQATFVASGGTFDVQLHAVLGAQSDLAEWLVSADLADSACSVIGTLVALLVPLLCPSRSCDTASAASTSPLVRTLQGLEALNVPSGAYGQST